MDLFFTILKAVIVFSALIFIHELGHFMAAKWSGITVNEFALGMGPKIISFVRGETRYSLRLFPIGGFCAMEGEDEDSSSPGSFGNAPILKRMIVMIAGAAMNILLGLVLVGILSSQLASFGTNVIGGFREGATSNQVLQVGDTIHKINGHRVRTVNDINYEFGRERDGIMSMVIIRDGEKINLDSVEFKMENIEGVSYITRDFTAQQAEKTFATTVRNTFNWTLSMVKQVWGSLVDLVTGRYTVNQLSGPVGVTVAIGQVSSFGWFSLLQFVAMITINLGVFNLLPLPALDGGRLIFLLIELVRRKPVAAKYEGVVHAVGFMLLIGLMIFVTVNDVVKLL